MNVLVVGSGGREHALCRALAASSRIEALFCAPGNGGIAEVAQCVDIEAMDFEGIVGFCRSETIGLVVVGPEAPLVAGLVDRLAAAGIPAFGPTAAAARLEGSKAFMKELCATAGVPTAAFACFDDADAAAEYITRHGAPIVVKADGLAAGKGVVVARTVEEAVTAAREMLAGRLGAAGRRIVVEDCLAGEEVSFFALVDGRTVVPLASAQDHKAAFDGDHGPNTGGMGAYSPAPVLTPALQATVVERIIAPTVAALADAGTPYRGILFAGLMLTAEGPSLLEYNVRFGDPECQVLLPRLQDDLLAVLLAAVTGSLDRVTLSWRPETALCVVLATRGYPGPYQAGSEIRELGPAAELPGVTIFHAGTRRDGRRLLATGGRVLGVTAIAATAAAAQARAYEAVDVINWPDGYCRRDIGWRAVAREQARLEPPSRNPLPRPGVIGGAPERT